MAFDFEIPYSGTDQKQNMLKRMVREYKSSKDNPKLLKEEWNKFADFLEDNTNDYEIKPIYHKKRERVCTIILCKGAELLNYT